MRDLGSGRSLLSSFFSTKMYPLGLLGLFFLISRWVWGGGRGEVVGGGAGRGGAGGGGGKGRMRNYMSNV